MRQKNKKLKVTSTGFYSLKAGALIRGCEHCVKGEKLVLFVTGLCSSRCDFCPVSDKKLYKDVVYANERQLNALAKGILRAEKGIIEEALACKAKGAGITGGDPLVTIDRTIRYIRLLKKKFGKRFHIHLYTPLELVDERRLNMLHSAGLDEIRFHPKYDPAGEKLWGRIALAKKQDYLWKVGVEVPAVPGKEKEMKKLVDFLAQGISKASLVDFLNINELELADNAVWKKAKNTKCKDDISYAILGSDSLARKIIAYAAKLGLPTHYCTCKLKDKVQLAERIKRRARTVRFPTDKVTSEGMLLRGAIYLQRLTPGFGYRAKIDKLKAQERKKITSELIQAKAILQRTMPAKKIVLDKEKFRLLTSEAIVRKIPPRTGLVRALLREYPTFDSLELDVELLDQV